MTDLFVWDVAISVCVLVLGVSLTLFALGWALGREDDDY